MKTKRSNLSSQLLILAMAGFVILLTLEAAQAQVVGDDSLDPFENNESLLAQSSTSRQGSFQNQTATQQAQVIRAKMPKQSLGKRLLENTSLSYYHQFLGPTLGGPSGQTYNVFQEGVDAPNTGHAPVQSFHAINVRHQITTDWAIGATLSAVNGYTDSVQNMDQSGNIVTNNKDTEFFNARAYLGMPSIKMGPTTLFTTLSVEAPTSSTSKLDDMRYGWVISQSLAFSVPDPRWNVGVAAQVYRVYYKNNVKAPPFAPSLGGKPTNLQTMIVSGGPYVNYRFSDSWMLGSVFIFDWDQRGDQTGTTKFNNNLPHRGRLSLTYFPQKIKYLQSVGLFSQALLENTRADNTAIGADFAVKF